MARGAPVAPRAMAVMGHHRPRREGNQRRSWLRAQIPAMVAPATTSPDSSRRASMRLEGLHHITMITGDAQANVAFYADVLGLRLVKKTVNFDDPSAYHLYFGDETGAPGSILTWFEFAGARPGRAGAGMIHTLTLGVPSAASVDFWQQRLAAKGANPTRLEDGSLRVADPDGLTLHLVVAADGNPPLQAVHPDVPAEHAITGLEGARAYAMFSAV